MQPAIVLADSRLSSVMQSEASAAALHAILPVVDLLGQGVGESRPLGLVQQH